MIQICDLETLGRYKNQVGLAHLWDSKHIAQIYKVLYTLTVEDVCWLDRKG